jgi:hypothetical protein
MSFADTLTKCAALWASQSIATGPPVPEEVIRETWSAFGQRVSQDVLTLYSTFGGFARWEFDEEFFWSLWPWDLLIERNKEERQTGIMFCDHSIEVLTWELRYENEEVSSVWSTTRKDQTALSLESFLEVYLNDPWQLG